jgi:RNA polymerase sigma-70 factor (ECF subfamily)
MGIDNEDFESLVRRYEPMLFRVVYNFSLSVPVAEEIVQDVFLQCFDNLKSINSPEHLKAWLRRVATHRCIDTLRSGVTAKELALDQLPEVACATTEPGDPLLSEQLRRLVASLPERLRMIVILRYGEDMDSDEIGEVMDMPASTVRSYLKRALAMLREKACALGDEIYGQVRKRSE